MLLLRSALVISMVISIVASGQPSYYEDPEDSMYLSQQASSEYSGQFILASQPISTQYSDLSIFTGRSSSSSAADEGLTPASGYYSPRKMQVLQTGSNEATARIPNSLQDSGQIRSDGTYSSYPNVGSSGGTNAQAILGFDISSIPQDADILSVSLQFEGWDMVGTPFSRMGCLDIFPVSYRLLGSQSYSRMAVTTPCLKVCSSTQMNSPLSSSLLTNALQSTLGQEKFQLRLQFEGEGEAPEPQVTSRVYTIGGSSSDDYLSSGTVRRYISGGDSGDSYISISSSYDPEVMQDMGLDRAFLQSDLAESEACPDYRYILLSPGVNLTKLGITPEMLEKAIDPGRVRIASGLSGYDTAYLIGSEMKNTFNGTWGSDASIIPSCPEGYCQDFNNDGICDSSELYNLKGRHAEYGRSVQDLGTSNICCPDFDNDGRCDEQNILPITESSNLIKIGGAWLIIAYRLPPPPCDQASCQAQSKPTGQPYARGGRLYQAFSACSCIEGECRCASTENDIGPVPCDQASCQAKSMSTSLPYARGDRLYQAFSDCNCIEGTCLCNNIEKDMGPAPCDQASCQAKSKAVGKPYSREGRNYQQFSECSCKDNSCDCKVVERETEPSGSTLINPMVVIPGLGNTSFKPPDSKWILKTSEWGEVPANQILVMLRNGSGQYDIEQLADLLGGRVVGYIDFINLYQIETSGKTEADLRNALSRAKADPTVMMVSPHQSAYLEQSPLDDPIYAGGRGRSYEIVGVQQAWELITDSGLPLSEVYIGVTDDGLYRGYGEFSGEVMVNATEPQSELTKPKSFYPENVSGSHGTGIMNILAADPNNGGLVGIASKPLGKRLHVEMINIETSSKYTESPGRSWYFCALGAIQTEIANNSSILSISWGNSNATDLEVFAFKNFVDMVGRLNDDILFVCSAGNNEGAVNGTHRFPYGNNLSNVITVGSILNNGKLYNSNKRSKTFEITLAAPGEQSVWGMDDKNRIVCEGNDILEFGGTSMATPFVTAAAALIRSLDPSLSAKDIKELLVETGRTDIKAGNNQVAAPAEVGGRILAIDLAVQQVISNRMNSTD